ncbi:NB-ARC domain-containing protein [Streptomyces cellulosae]
MALIVALAMAATVWLVVVAARDGWGEADPVASVFGAVVGLASLVTSLAMTGNNHREPTILTPTPPELEDWIVHRDEVEIAVAAICQRQSDATIALTTALKGAGGFGKTTLAKQICADFRVQQVFKKEIYFISIGRETRSRAAIAAKVANAIRSITGEIVADTQDADPIRMGEHLGHVLARQPKTLLVIDDVWETDQLAPFLQGAQESCVRLVTTRNPDILPRHTTHITVDRLSPAQAAAVLSYNLTEPLPQPLADALIKATGRWALLLRMVNQFISALTATGLTCSEAAEQMSARLRSFGPAGADQDAPLELNDPERRNRAVRASIQAATTLLPNRADQRFAELGIFAEDEQIPMRIVTALWRGTAELDEPKSRHLCKQMADLSLVTLNADVEGGALEIHDVIRDYLRAELGSRLSEVNSLFLDALGVELETEPALRSTASETQPWWQLEGDYLRDHLISHLLDAQRQGEAESLAGDIRWVQMRLHHRGPTSPVSDLELVATGATRTLAADLVRASHLLYPAERPNWLNGVLRSRLHALPHWNEQSELLTLTPPFLSDRWAPPDLPHPSLLRTLVGHTKPVTEVAVSPTGTWLASTSGDCTIRLWDATTGSQTLVITGHSDSVTSVAISPDGTWLVTASLDGTARIWDAREGVELARLESEGQPVTALAISHDGTWLATAHDEGLLVLWDIQSQRPRMEIRTNERHIGSLAISPDSTWIASSGEGVASIWDVTTGRKRLDLRGHSASVIDVAISPSGEWIATTSADWTARVWDAHNGEELHVFEDDNVGVIWSVAISPDSCRMAICHDNGSVSIYNIHDENELQCFTGHTDVALGSAFSPNGEWLVTGGHDNTVRIWDLRAQQTASGAGHNDRPWSLAVSRDGTMLATSSLDRTVRIWDAETGHQQHVLGHNSAVWHVEFSPDGAWAVTASSDETARMWDTAAGRLRYVFTGHSGAVWVAKFSADGSRIVTAAEDGTAKIWETLTGRELHTLSGHDDSVGSVALDSTGSRLVTVSQDQTIRVWDIESGTQLHVLTGHERLVQEAVFGPDGSWFVTASNDCTARIWDTRTGLELRILSGHTGPIWSVSVSPDGASIATASDDATTRIWDTATGTELHRLTGHTQSATRVSFHHSGRWVATTGEDKTVRIWEVATGEALTMMRIDAAPNRIAWSPTQPAIFISGEAGPFGYNFVPTEAT